MTKDIKIKFVKKANMWCVTSFNKEQKTKYFPTKKEAEEYAKK